MSGPRFFTGESLESSPREIRLDEEEARHLVSVLRLEPGDPATLFDGRGYEMSGVVREAKKSTAVIAADGPARFLPRMPAVEVDLFCALPRSGAADDVLRTAIEAGARSVTPLSTRRAVHRPEKKPEEERRRRMTKIALAAMKQSGRNVFPEFGAPMEVDDLTLPGGEVGVFGALTPEARLLRDLEDELGGFPRRVRVVVGPEGGLDPFEEAALGARGFRAVILTPQILRVETAVTAFLTAFALVPPRRVRIP